MYGDHCCLHLLLIQEISKQVFVAGLGGLSTGLGGGGGLGGGLVTGMSVKFEPVPGTDTINNKNGSSQTVATKLYCISAMKQYETQSLEVSNLITVIVVADIHVVITHKPLSSLYFQIVHMQEIRISDYQAGRKGPSGGGGLGTGLGLGGGLMGNQAGGLGTGEYTMCIVV